MINGNKTLTLTIDEIKLIYRAGFRRGEAERSAYEWGVTASGKEFDNLVEEVYDIVNKGKAWNAVNIIPQDVVEDWFK